jgi:hypothetical protein
MAALDIIAAMRDPELFGHAFEDIKSWQHWLTVLRVLFGLKLSATDLARFTEFTGRTVANPDGHTEAWLICGRRSGKSRILALIAAYLACFRDWTPYLAPGERGRILIAARNRDQAKGILDYLTGLLLESPLLHRQVINQTADSLELAGRITIEVVPSHFRSIRGRTVVAALLDEIAFWDANENAANPDQEVLAAIRPAMATIPGSMLLCASSPYARQGALYEAFDTHYGKDDSAPLIWRAPTRAMNATVPQSYIDREIASNPSKNRSEYLSEFRNDVEGFVSLDTVKACVGPYIERGHDSSQRYVAFVDPSGGRSDSFTLAIGHREGDALHIDGVWAKPAPFSPDQVISEFAHIIRLYRVSAVVGDAYAGDFPRSIFQRHGITYSLSKKTRTELYQSLLPLLNSGAITMPDDPILIKQLVGLERTIIGGRERIDHARGQHDDQANALAGCAELCVIAGLAPVAQFGTYSQFAPPIAGVAGNYGRSEPKSKFDGAVTITDQRGNSATGFASSRG